MKITCGIYLYNAINNKFLICHATKSKNAWSIPKGLKEPDEDEFQAAKRELFEETNIKLDQVVVLKVFKLPLVKYEKQKKVLASYLIISTFQENEFELKCHSKVDDKFPEIDNYNWVDINQITSLVHKTQGKNISEIRDFLLNFTSKLPDPSNLPVAHTVRDTLYYARDKFPH